MAKRGSTKWLSQRQEDRVAARFGGVRSPSSGAALADPGDVRASNALVECKHTGTFDKPAAGIRISLADFEKIADEAWSLGKVPIMALAVYNPESVLSDGDGTVNLILRLERDDPELQDV